MHFPEVAAGQGLAESPLSIMVRRKNLGCTLPPPSGSVEEQPRRHLFTRSVELTSLFGNKAQQVLCRLVSFESNVTCQCCHSRSTSMLRLPCEEERSFATCRGAWASIPINRPHLNADVRLITVCEVACKLY